MAPWLLRQRQRCPIGKCHCSGVVHFRANRVKLIRKFSSHRCCAAMPHGSNLHLRKRACRVTRASTTLGTTAGTTRSQHTIYTDRRSPLALLSEIMAHGARRWRWRHHHCVSPLYACARDKQQLHRAASNETAIVVYRPVERGGFVTQFRPTTAESSEWWLGYLLRLLTCLSRAHEKVEYKQAFSIRDRYP